MTRNITTAFIAGCMLLTSSCTKDILGKKPKDSISELDVWKDMSLVSNYATYFYSTLQSGYSRNFYLCEATDDAIAALDNDPYTIVPLTTDASWTPVNAPFNDYYERLYKSIRKANDFLERIDAVPGDADQRKQLKAEIRFFRAYYYAELINYFSDDPVTAAGILPSGAVRDAEKAWGVVLLDKTQVFGEDDLSVPRSTKGACIDFVVKELHEAATAFAQLPASYTKDAGRLTQGAALGLKVRVLLYAGRFKDAAAAAREVMSLNKYQLYPDYKTLFTVKNNQECIISVQHNNIALERAHTLDKSVAPGSMSGQNAMCPTQNLVDEYEMTDGKLPAQSPLYNANDPYTGRDKRFYATIAYDGSSYRGRMLQLSEGGFDIVNSGAFKPRTRYMMRKGINEGFNFLGDASLGSDQNWQLLRYAEILLNYAEAQNEDAGPDNSVYEAVNAIRRRAGQPDLSAGLSQEQMRAAIRHERRIEFAFEDQRFWDLRRWHIAHLPAAKEIYGTIIRKSADGTTAYSRQTVQSRYFELKNYCFPIPNADVLSNRRMEQNTLWK
ncbi:RagB/SusD family nutrient uptake outer membrane protein [Chitinophaga solisilvae]|uniref:RagB/SusD family nutrient uptake outer membrane protein n=1 Tax=Chitinophaga solisilvae TaxID=1233460 RepID=UPI00136CC71A|nr:RagB/SusD family nutrient uptake outer membrane protein [Chitinophaga solisilvae]